jgi:hypothetical protein
VCISYDSQNTPPQTAITGCVICELGTKFLILQKIKRIMQFEVSRALTVHHVTRYLISILITMLDFTSCFWHAQEHIMWHRYLNRHWHLMWEFSALWCIHCLTCTQRSSLSTEWNDIQNKCENRNSHFMPSTFHLQVIQCFRSLKRGRTHTATVTLYTFLSHFAY